ncbi:AAC(3) family N-acetyltransferase [Cellulomonas sp.]|uniref:aminoglycoside N(3)-acetyltransferase n=1 Tax=Cellulomonas sp. TaxID=40001 RepID=UPI001B04F24A|nr:AAC(3) family N-acetyltransferase [Cellulomonas sp.]MBO9553922.1 AAC(3) family N-acetyltransferase [Cellulomonas sp.]
MTELVTQADLVRDLRALGLAAGSVVLVHASLSRLGAVAGGEQAVVLALEEVLGPNGTIVVPTQSWHLCDPAYLGDPSVPPDRWDAVRAALPAYDPAWTPTRTMGAVADAVRTRVGAIRSAHPHRSFAAVGPLAGRAVERHDLADPVGEGSPLAALYALDARVLLLGVGHDKNTSLHLAEARSGLPVTTVPNGAPVLVDGVRRWVAFDEPVVDDADFVEAGAAFAAARLGERHGVVGHADARLMPVRALVDFAGDWFRRTRPRRPAPVG